MAILMAREKASRRYLFTIMFHDRKSALYVKKNDGLDYLSSAFKQFCIQWKIQHVTGIPCNSQSQTVHKQLKKQMDQFKWEEEYGSE